MSDLTLEVRNQDDRIGRIGSVLITPPISETYWTYRVQLTDTQAIIGFPKFNTIGIGFAREEDWNTNLPYTCSADEIFDHIEHNKDDLSITKEDCLAAIEMIQNAVREVQTRA